MDYSKPVESGQIAFIRGAKRSDNPVDGRTHANHKVHWDNGWLKQSQITCKGIELPDGAFSGCTQTHGDCPVCGL